MGGPKLTTFGYAPLCSSDVNAGVREGQNMAQNGPRLCTFLALEPSRDP